MVLNIFQIFKIGDIVLIIQTLILGITLVVLVWQIKELRKSVHSSSFLTVGQSYIPSMLKIIENPQLAKCLKICDNKNLNDEEIKEKIYIHIMLCNFVNAYVCWKEGYYTEDAWDAWKRWFKEWMVSEKFKQEWCSTKNIFSNGFIEIVEDLINE